MFNTEFENTLINAQQICRQIKSRLLSVEVLLCALVDNKEAKKLLLAAKVDVAMVKQKILQKLEDSNADLEDWDISSTAPTMGFQRVLQRAVFRVQGAGKKEVTGADVLIAIMDEIDSIAVYELKRYNVTKLKLQELVSHSDDLDIEDDFEQQVDEEGQVVRALDKYAVNLNAEAKMGRIDPMIGRSEELERVLQVLSRRKKNNPLLVGEAGVGKTAIAEGLALQIVNGKVPESLLESIVYSLDIGAIVAGTKYRGDFEKRFKSILKDIEKEQHAILFIDEIHTIIGAGAASGGTMDVGNMLKPLLSSGKLRCLGATTYQEYKVIFDKEKALARRFQKVEVVEPTQEEAVLILKGLRAKYEEHHGVKYTDEAIEAAVALSVKYINDRFLPDKAIDIMDEAGARQKILVDKKKKMEITVDIIEKVIAKIARIPEKTVSASEIGSLSKLDRDLKLTVFGQDHAIDMVTSAVRMSRSGLGNDEKPVGSFLFAGSTGVGKTELSKQLAKTLGVELLRFDMSEYMEKHTISRLIGAPAGYVGHEEGGLLTEAVIKNPHAVVLLDEIEKAHSDIYNVLLQVMDYGSLTDSSGRKADFRNVTLIMTTNAGVQQVVKKSIGFMSEDENISAEKAAMVDINKVFSPEFRNRLDAVVWFNPLGMEVISSVVDKFIVELEMKLEKKNVTLSVTKKARTWLGEKGYDRAMGARPMDRVFQEHLRKPLSNQLLFGDLVKGGQVKVDMKAGELTITCKEKKKEVA